MPIIRIPQLCDSARLQKLGQPGESCVILKVQNIGSTGEHEVIDKEGRCYRLKWSAPHGGHIIRIPFSLWSQNKHRLAHDLMEQQWHYPLVVLIEDNNLRQVVPANQEGSYSSQDGATPSPASIQEAAKDEAVREKADIVLKVILGGSAGDQTPPTDETANVEAPGPQSLMYGEMPLHQAAADLVKEKAQRVKDVAALLEVSEDDLKTALAEPESKAELGNAGWVRLKDSTPS